MKALLERNLIVYKTIFYRNIGFLIQVHSFHWAKIGLSIYKNLQNRGDACRATQERTGKKQAIRGGTFGQK
jgi:hypothetical protein